MPLGRRNARRSSRVQILHRSQEFPVSNLFSLRQVNRGNLPESILKTLISTSFARNLVYARFDFERVLESWE